MRSASHLSRALVVAACFLILTVARVSASDLSGKVMDPHGQPLEAVSVITEQPGLGTMTDADGRFTLEFDAEISRVTFSRVGYTPRQFLIGDVPSVVVLEEALYLEDGILVRGDRAQTGVSAIAFDNITREEIERDYTVGEFPLLLESTPNLYAYTEGGGPLGASGLSIRGFDGKRIATYINGVPLNDPEDHNTYFVDLPDFASNISDIQVQRGVGNSLYGDASFGGSINIVSSLFDKQRSVKLTSGYGEFTRDGDFFGHQISRQSVEYSSGLVDGRWAFSGRFSKQSSDGYRDNSWYDGWSYYVSAGRLDPNMVTELHVYGGPVKYHLAYYGISKAEVENDRTANPLDYANMIDNFNQPHYQLHNTYFINDRTTLSNSIYYIRGKGYYEQFKSGRDYSEHNLTALSDSAFGDLVRQKWVEKNQVGWNPRLDVEHGQGRHSIGGSFYYFDSEHWGQVVSAQYLNGPIDPTHRYYIYSGRKYVASIYAQERYSLTEKLTTQATVQLRYSSYDFEEERMGAFTGHQFDLDYLFLSPRIGFNYTVSEGVSSFVNFGVASRAPNDENVYDAGDPDKFPQLEILSLDTTSVAGDTLYTFGDPEVESERLYDLEIGANMRRDRYRVSLNLFWMRYENENVFEGRRDDKGRWITFVIDRAVHSGLELSGAAQASDWISFQGSVSYNFNRIQAFDGVVDSLDASWDYAGSVSRDFTDKVVPAFPEYLGSLIIDAHRKGIRFVMRNSFVGKRYMDMANTEDLAVEPYYSASVRVSYTVDQFLEVGNFTVSGSIDNVFDKKYVTNGYGGNSVLDDGTLAGWAEYFVGPERTFYGQVSLELF
ncbi:MAG: TonB-dependent receptor [Candidatus Zixiibacteriota bacterium]|nr:MAG: TonB-dependent receptor [candidate division Zixibacteria bacterium]